MVFEGGTKMSSPVLDVQEWASTGKKQRQSEGQEELIPWSKEAEKSGPPWRLVFQCQVRSRISIASSLGSCFTTKTEQKVRGTCGALALCHVHDWNGIITGKTHGNENEKNQKREIGAQSNKNGKLQKITPVF